MKLLYQILRTVLYPLIWCHQVIMEAPIVCCDSALISYSDYNRCGGDCGGSSHSHRSVSRSESGWVCRAQ